MKTIFKIVWFAIMPLIGFAQTSAVDSLKRALEIASSDSARYVISLDIGFYYRTVNLDSAVHYDDIAIGVARKNGQVIDWAMALDEKGYVLMHLGRYTESFRHTQEALRLLQDPKIVRSPWATFPGSQGLEPEDLRQILIATCNHHLGHLMGRARNYRQQIYHYEQTRSIIVELGEILRLAGFARMNMGAAYLDLHVLDTALIMEEEAIRIFREEGEERYLPTAYVNMVDIHLAGGDLREALKYLHEGIGLAVAANNLSTLSELYGRLAGLHIADQNADSSLFYAQKNLQLLQSMESEDLGEAYQHLSQSYDLRNERDSAYRYLVLASEVNTRQFDEEIQSVADFQMLTFEEQQKLEALEREKVVMRNRNRIYALVAAIASFLVIGLILYRNNLHKQKANEILQKTLTDLKNTQTQLIHSEKMASLGELTAGIAHEIQNPLNFVNNFSDLNEELMQELAGEIEKGDLDGARAIAADIIANEKKIKHHGKRAEGIVRSMLEHSRATPGEKQPADLNALADEYLRLAYHGMRARYKSFNVEMKTQWDESLTPIKIVSQEIGRVLLNLITNAFYAVHEKAIESGNEYAPTVWVITSGGKDSISISVKDNADGIPKNALDKIFQPFFTTKPTGEGTGLGLSLSYDIIKAHGGELKVETKEGEGSEFTVVLPTA